MLDPYRLLGVVRGASDDEIRCAWLRMIRQFPPDLHPERFKQLRMAFEIIESRRSRIAFELFNSDMPERDELLDPVMSQSKRSRPDVASLRLGLRHSVRQGKTHLLCATDE